MVFLESHKGVNLSIKTVLILMVGAVVVLSVIAAWGSFEGDTERSLSDSNDQAGAQSERASCVLECRQENLGGGGDYEGCVQNCP